ncbi:hypothetical protein CRG98_002704 [Punica granatum]|uniref:Uncharacterized protein n=1 Tax=Punica granatum TaxID=22663 RepID=A0A2I0L885_PUNGR|nr:hypothetical protein CRG98_002704 [Punica granatum]
MAGDRTRYPSNLAQPTSQKDKTEGSASDRSDRHQTGLTAVRISNAGQNFLTLSFPPLFFLSFHFAPFSLHLLPFHPSLSFLLFSSPPSSSPLLLLTSLCHLRHAVVAHPPRSPATADTLIHHGTARFPGTLPRRLSPPHGPALAPWLNPRRSDHPLALNCPNCPDSRDAHLEHGVAQVVLAVVSRVLSRRRRGTQKLEPPSAAAGILPSAHLRLLRSSSLSRARPIFLRFAQIQPVRPSSIQPRRSDPVYGLTHSVSPGNRPGTGGSRRAAQSGPAVLFRSLTLPSATQLPWRLSSREFGLVPACSAQLACAWPSLPA